MVTKTIRAVSQKTTTKGETYYSVMFTDGSNASCFESLLFPILMANNGKTVEVEETTDKTGKYHNIKAIQAAKPENRFVEELKASDTEVARQRSISRSVALNNAVTLYQHQVDIDTEKICATAETFEAWLNR